MHSLKFPVPRQRTAKLTPQEQPSPLPSPPGTCRDGAFAWWHLAWLSVFSKPDDDTGMRSGESVMVSAKSDTAIWHCLPICGQIRDDSGRRKTLQCLDNEGRDDVGGLPINSIGNFESGAFVAFVLIHSISRLITLSLDLICLYCSFSLFP